MKRIYVLVAALVCLFFTAERLYAAPPAGSGGVWSLKSVRIEKVGSDHIYLGERKFLVDKETVVAGAKGERITLASVATGSKGDIEYYFGDNNRPTISKIALLSP